MLEKISSLVTEYCNKNFDFSFNSNKPVVRLHEPSFGAEEINVVIEKMLSTFVTMGKEVRKFEEQYSKELGYGYSIMSNSGSSANLLALAALANHATKDRLNNGDEVIVPALSWSTTVWPVIQNNLVPVFVDCDPQTYNFDLNKLESAITEKTKAIMLVHVYGNPCDMDGIMALCKKYNLQLIEDSCESMGAYYDGKSVGSFGRVGTFSTYYSHHMTTFEGGLTVTNDFDLTETMRVLRAHGWSREADEHQKYVEKYPDIDPRFIFINLGYNLRPTEMQGAMGQKQLPKLKGFVEKRRETASFYLNSFKKYEEFFSFQKETEKAYSSWFGFGFVLKDNCPFSVSDITSFLQKNRIETRPIIAGNISRHPVMEHYEYRVAGDLNNSNKIMDRGFAIGCHHAIDENARKYVLEKFDEFFKSKNLV